ncbi:MAG: hypothetical protein KBA46_03070 [Candidatus Omnitrophica bacterium]|nr:hypothetical protein [Candidatus Omnitrophota bacterium]
MKQCPGILILAILSWLGIVIAQDNTEVKIFKIQHAQASDLAPIVNEFKGPAGKVSVDVNSNALIVLDDPTHIARIALMVEELDIAQKQIKVKVMVVEGTDDFLKEVGITASRVVIPDAAFKAMIQAMSIRSDVRIASDMTVVTLSGEPAQLQVTTDQIFGVSTMIFSDGTRVTNLERQPVGEFLEVLPTANNDGTITVVIRPTSSRMVADAVSSVSTAMTQLRVRDGDTIVFGSLDSEQEHRQAQREFFGIPVGQQQVKQEKKVLMLLTPTLQ